MEFLDQEITNNTSELRRDALPSARAIVYAPRIADEELLRSADASTPSTLERFRLTDSKPDLSGAVIYADGVDTAAWEQNGSVLWGHRMDHPAFILGAPQRIIRHKKAIDAVLRFATPEENEMGAMVLRMVRGNLVRGGSVRVAFVEVETSTTRGGVTPLDVIRSIMLEFSITPIPMNPRAARQAVRTFTANDERSLLKQLAEQTADMTDTPESVRDAANALVRALEGNPTRVYAARDPVVALINRLA